MHAPTIRPMTPLTPAQRAHIQLVQLLAFAEKLEGDELLQYRMALSELRDLLTDYGDMGALAFRVLQLETVVADAGEQPAARH